MSSTSKFVSTPELWYNGVFNVLPFSSIETLLMVNKLLHSFSIKITHPTHLGIYPIGFWLNFILPLLDHKDLKNFQKVSQVARKLTLSKKISKQLFRSDVKVTSLNKIQSGTKIEDWRTKPRLPAINPFLGTITYILNMEYEKLYVRAETTYDDNDKHPSVTHGIESYKAVDENATEPAVPILFVESFEKECYRYGGEGERPYIRVVGTGRPLFGGKHCSVTCGDVMKALVKDCERFSEWDGDHRYYEGFSSFEKANGQFVLSDIFWGS